MKCRFCVSNYCFLKKKKKKLMELNSLTTFFFCRTCFVWPHFNRAASLDKIFDAIQHKCKQFALWQSVRTVLPVEWQQFIYCPFLLLLAINKSLIVFWGAGGLGWSAHSNWQSIHLGVDSVPTKGNCMLSEGAWQWAEALDHTGPDAQSTKKGKQSCRQLFNAFL